MIWMKLIGWFGEENGCLNDLDETDWLAWFGWFGEETGCLNDLDETDWLVWVLVWRRKRVFE